MKEYPEGHDTVIQKGTCPKCGSSGFRRYADGHATCYGAGCDYFEPASGDPQGVSGGGERLPQRPSSGGNLLDHREAPTNGFSKRNLRKATLDKFGIFEAPGPRREQVYPYYDQQDNLVAQKLRGPNKTFAVLKGEGYTGLDDCRLFGHQVYGDKFDRQVIITEGELDAASVAQALDFKVAVVSIGTGAGKNAAKHLKANYLWLDRFKEIILFFDDDEPGKIATEECAKLFKVGKVRVARVPGFKDPSDALQANKPGDIQQAVYMAKAWRPKGIVNAADTPDDVLDPKEEDHAFAFKWPWQPLDDKLGPILPGQVCYHVAGTGVGKSTGITEVLVGLMRQGAKVASMGFEDTRRDAKLRIMTTWFDKRLDLQEVREATPEAERLKMHEEVFGSRRVELFDPETAEWSVEAILGYVRYCAKALDCQVIFIDPLSFIVAGLSQAADERRALDSVSRDLAALAKELGVHIQISHHLSRPMGTAHEEGASTSLNQVRGSGGIANFATFVIGHERNQQAEGDDFLLTQLRALKNRPRSVTGVMLVLAYNLGTGRLTPTNRPFPQPGSKKGGEGPGGFPPMQAGDDY